MAADSPALLFGAIKKKTIQRYACIVFFVVGANRIELLTFCL